MKFKFISITTVVLCIVFSCKKGPKVISPSSNDKNSEKSTGIFSEEPSSESNVNSSFADDLHRVLVSEVLPTSKYVYLNVKEGERQFWVATIKQDVSKGRIYFYKGGLLKTNFESKEYNRVFDTVYLVTSLVEENHAKNAGIVNESKTTADQSASTPVKEVIPTHTEKIIEHKGSIKIADLVKDPKKYAGKTIQISGLCTKVNPGIMDRNWIHLKDGSKDNFDLVVTSNTFVQEGSVVTMKALVTLNKDFGAGYKYDLILEDGVIVK